MSNNMTSIEKSNLESDNSVVNNKYANDGSFLQLFQKMQKQLINNNNNDLKTSDNIDVNNSNIDIIVNNECLIEEKSDEMKTNSIITANNTKNSIIPKTSSTIITKKRRTKALKVGLIKKQRNESSLEDNNDGNNGGNNAWNHYMKEVRMYKEKYGDDNDKNRPLVK